MEVFVAFRDLSDVPLLGATMDEWERCGAEPVAIQVKKKMKFELFRRIAADEKATEDFYLLADLGCVLADLADFKNLKLDDVTGMAGLKGTYKSDIPVGVRLIRRRAVNKWEPPITDDYCIEHARAMKNSGWKVSVFQDIFYK